MVEEELSGHCDGPAAVVACRTVQQREEVVQCEIESASLSSDHPADAWRLKVSIDQQHPATSPYGVGAPLSQLTGQCDAVQRASDSALEGVKGADSYTVWE
ncbi:hypothetical protein ASE41_07535 [Streptomyces sp. Root264]|nr:hypothetical protein ASE41_07535 [Streptomyces sp. Root264]